MDGYKRRTVMSKWEDAKMKYKPITDTPQLPKSVFAVAMIEIIQAAEEEIAELNELLSDQAVKNIDLEKEITQLREDLEKAYGRALNAIKENGEHR